MKILHVVRQYAPAVGGLESYVRSMARHQKALGHDVTILTLNRVFHGQEGVLPATETIDGISIKRVPFTGFRRFFIPFVSPSFFKDFDVVHVHNTDVFFDYVALASVFARRPVFATTHGGFFHTRDFSLIKKVYFNLVTRLSCSRYNAIFAISQNDYDTFKGTNKNLFLYPNAIEPLGNDICSGNGFLYIGRLAAHKNVAQVVETYAALRKNHGVTGALHVVGPEWDVKIDDLKAQARALGVEDGVKFHGFISPEEMKIVLKDCGWFVSASAFEGFGMSMLEAMTVGLVPFVQPNESFKELIAQAGIGINVDFSAAEQAAAAIAQLMPKITAQDRAGAQAFARKFSWDELTEKTLAVYGSCADRPVLPR